MIYEVNLRVEPAIADAYLAWLETHIAEMLHVPGFVSAELMQATDTNAGELTVLYRVASMAALQDYFDNRAPAMRGSVPEDFLGRFEIQRRVLQPVARFAAGD